MRRAGAVAAAMAAVLVFAVPAGATEQPPGAQKNLELVKTLPEAKYATAINFLQYGHGRHKRDVHDRHRPLRADQLRPDADRSRPRRLDSLENEALRLQGDPPVDFGDARRQRLAGLDVLAERGHGRRPAAQAGVHGPRPALVQGDDRERHERGRRLRRRRARPARPAGAELHAAPDGPHDHVHQRLPVPVDGRAGGLGRAEGDRAGRAGARSSSPTCATRATRG